MANNSLDLITDHDDLINLPPPPHATSPLRETQIERKYKLPGFETLRAVHYDGTEQSLRYIDLTIDVFNFFLARRIHLHVAKNSTTKNQWFWGWEQLHNHHLHGNVWPWIGQPVATPFEPYHPWTLANPQNKLRKLVVDLAKHFHDELIRKKAEQGISYVPVDLREELGHRIFSERTAQEKLLKEASSAKKAGKEKEHIENEAAEKYLGLVPSGRGVSAPSGVELTADVLEGLSKLGTHTASHTSKLYFIISHSYLILMHIRH